MAADLLGYKVKALLCSEIAEDAILVTKVAFPEAVQLGPVQDVTDAMIEELTNRYDTEIFVFTMGPPCTDASLLNNQRAGAHGPHNVLREEAKRVYNTFEAMAVGRVVGIMDCTRMSDEDRVHYDAVFGSQPFQLCARHWAPWKMPRGGVPASRQLCLMATPL